MIVLIAFLHHLSTTLFQQNETPMSVAAIDSSFQAYIDQLVASRAAVATGLLLGHSTVGENVSIVHHIPTPLDPNETTGERKSWSLDDQQWFMNHLEEVSYLTQGGLDVVGAYFYGPQSVLDAVNIVAIGKRILERGNAADALVSGLKSAPLAPVTVYNSVIVKCAQTSKFTSTVFSRLDSPSPSSSASSTPTPGSGITLVDAKGRTIVLKSSPLLPKLTSFSTTIPFEERICIPSSSSTSSSSSSASISAESALRDRLHRAVCALAGRLSSGVAAVDGAPVRDAKVTVEKLPQAKKQLQQQQQQQQKGEGSADALPSADHEVQFMFPVSNPAHGLASMSSTSTISSGTWYTLSGVLEARAVVSPRATLAQVLDALRADLLRSLMARVRVVILDYAESSSTPNNLSLPRRVWIPLTTSTSTSPSSSSGQGPSAMIVACTYPSQGVADADAVVDASELLNPSSTSSASSSASSSAGDGDTAERKDAELKYYVNEAAAKTASRSSPSNNTKTSLSSSSSVSFSSASPSPSSSSSASASAQSPNPMYLAAALILLLSLLVAFLARK